MTVSTASIRSGISPMSGTRYGIPARRDLALRAHEPLRHRRRRDEEGARDFVGLEAAERPQRERDLRLQRERRVAAGEDQPQAIVRDLVAPSSGSSGTDSRARRAGPGQRLELSLQPSLAAEAIDGSLRAVWTIHARGNSGTPADRHGLQRGRERLLGDLFGKIEVANRRIRVATMRPQSAR